MHIAYILTTVVTRTYEVRMHVCVRACATIKVCNTRMYVRVRTVGSTLLWMQACKQACMPKNTVGWGKRKEEERREGKLNDCNSMQLAAHSNRDHFH